MKKIIKSIKINNQQPKTYCQLSSIDNDLPKTPTNPNTRTSTTIKKASLLFAVLKKYAYSFFPFTSLFIFQNQPNPLTNHSIINNRH